MINLYVNVDLDEVYSELGAYDKEKMLKMFRDEGYLKKLGYVESNDDEVEVNEYSNKWEESISKLSKVKQHSVSKEDEELIAKLAQKYYL
jgi:ribosomal protein S8